MGGEKITSPLLTRLHAWRPGRYLRASTGLLAWMLSRAAAQAVLLVVVARATGAQAYGQYVAALAVASFLAPLAGLGLANMLLRNTAKDPTHGPAYLAQALRVWLFSTTACATLAVPLAWALLPDGISWLPAFVAVIVEIAASSLAEIAGRYRQAQHRIHVYGVIGAGLAWIRLGAIALVLSSPVNAGIDSVFWAHAASGALYILMLWKTLHSRPMSGASERMTATSGVPFAMGALAMRLQAEFNKPVLAHLSFGAAGNFNIAQRVGELMSMPLLALQEALWPRLYAQPDPVRRLRRTGAILVALSLACAAMLWLAAPWIPVLLGPDFAEAVAVMRALALLPTLQVVRNLLNFRIIHAGATRLLGWAYGIGAAVSVAGVAWLVPTHGSSGAIASSYAAELAMIAVLCVAPSIRSKQ